MASNKRSMDEVLFDQDYLSDSELCGPLTQDFFESSQHFLDLPSQVGCGMESAPSTSNEDIDSAQKPSEDPDIEIIDRRELDDCISIREKSRRINRRYQAQEIILEVGIEIERLPESMRRKTFCSIWSILRLMFEMIIRRVSEDLDPADLMRFCIFSLNLDKPISTCLWRVHAFTADKVLNAIANAMESNEELHLDESLRMEITTIRQPVGAGRIRKVVNVECDRLNKRSILCIPPDSLGLCCGKAIVYAIAHLDGDKRAINAMKDRRRPALETRAKELHQKAGIPLGPCTFAEVAKFEEVLDIQIVVISAQERNGVAYRGKDRSRRINLWLHNGHYDVIKSLKGFYASNHYCERCDKPFQNLENHRCPEACHICLRACCSAPAVPKRCFDCDRLCQSSECFAAHKAMTGNQQLSICDRMYQCRKCCSVIRRRDCPKELHVCGSRKCPSCQKFVVLDEHLCCLPRVSPKQPNSDIIFFDFETDQSSGEHVVNFAVAQHSDGREMFFKGYSACNEFCTWLFLPKHKDHTVIAHNMKGFDGQFIVGWMLEQGTSPSVIPIGSKLMSIRHPSLSITIIDSMSFLPMALSKLPNCFGLSELKKGYFPHLFNVRENQNYVGKLPSQQFYCPDAMSSSARAVFMAWHADHKNDQFDFQKEMLEYCRSDVDILRRCCLLFREEFLKIADVDPFRYITIASACMATYRNGHIQDNTIAMVPVHGYDHGKKFSPDAIRWLDYVAFSEGISIKHALNGSGEKKICGSFVDGYCEENKTIYQFQGCFFHGCEICFDSDTIHPLKGTTMSSVRQKTRETCERSRSFGYRVVELWEHQFAEMKKEDTHLRAFLSTHELQDRLNPRDSFFGGRTNAIKLFHEGDIKYIDFTSLYPWVNKYCMYPVGHPQIITEGFNEIKHYFGIIRCKVVPPRGLYLPVLPYRSNDKLMFPLCRTCVETKQQSLCNHNDDERALIGTWVSEEVKLAEEKGYRISDIYEVYHFPTTSNTLFRTYIDTFLKIKQESSGWPQNCCTEDEKAAYIQEYEAKEGIKLDRENVSMNPGRRQVAKLALNSFWGRWGMNTLRSQLTYVNTVPEFNRMLADPLNDIKDVYFPTEEVAAIHWQSKKEYLAQDASTNVFLASFTTSWARIKLYGEMEKLGRSVLYHDTDSIIYASDGTKDPPLGNFLGEFTDELDGDTITTFVSAGPKNYAYETKSGKTSCKVRGFTLNYRNAEKLNFGSIQSLIRNMDDQHTIPLHNPTKITRDAKRRKVINKVETKIYRMVYDKRVIQEDYSTLPYGY